MSEWSVGLEVSESSSSEMEVSLSASHWFFPFFLLGGPPFFLASPLWPEVEAAGLEVEVAWTDAEVPPDCCLGLTVWPWPQLLCIRVLLCCHCERLIKGNLHNL